MTAMAGTLSSPSMSAVTVEEVSGAKALARFVELPHALHGSDPRFAPLVLSWERYRLDPRRNPFFERGDGAYFLARRRGRPAGRITAHLAAPGAEGRFGFWWVDDDPTVADALLDAAQAWLTEQGCTSMTGPLSFTVDEERGVQAAGFDAPGVTGRPWHPPHLVALLAAAGFAEVERVRTWRHRLERAAWDDVPVPGGERPGHAGRQLDPRLVLATIAAVPDVSRELGATGLRSWWSLVARARAREWRTATVVRWSPEHLQDDVATMRRAATAAGYEWLIAPCGPRDAAPETEHVVLRRTW